MTFYATLRRRAAAAAASAALPGRSRPRGPGRRITWPHPVVARVPDLAGSRRPAEVIPPPPDGAGHAAQPPGRSGGGAEPRGQNERGRGGADGGGEAEEEKALLEAAVRGEQDGGGVRDGDDGHPGGPERGDVERRRGPRRVVLGGDEEDVQPAAGFLGVRSGHGNGEVISSVDAFGALHVAFVALMAAATSFSRSRVKGSVPEGP